MRWPARRQAAGGDLADAHWRQGSAEDRALDGIDFPSDGWSGHGVAACRPASAGKTVPTARGPAARLFAFGYDAWLLVAYLERLATRADGNVQGATGALRIDGFGNVVRTPAWSTFSGGSRGAAGRWQRAEPAWIAARRGARSKLPRAGTCATPACTCSRATCAIRAANSTW